jgi:hypothetical protein
VGEQNIYTGDQLTVDLKQVEWDFLSHDFQSWNVFKDIVAKHTVLTAGRHHHDAKDDTRWKQLILDITEKLEAERKAEGGTSPFASRFAVKELVEGRAMTGFAKEMARVMGLDPKGGLTKAMTHAELKAFSFAKPSYSGGETVFEQTEEDEVEPQSSASSMPTGIDFTTAATPLKRREVGVVPGANEPDENREPIGPAHERLAHARKLTPVLAPDREMDDGETRFDFIRRIAAQTRDEVQMHGTTAATRRILQRGDEPIKKEEPGKGR